jgi:hypothetical protein
MGFFTFGIGHQNTSFSRVFRDSNDYIFLGVLDAKSLEWVYTNYMKSFPEFQNTKGKNKFYNMYKNIIYEQHPTEIDPETGDLRRMYNFVVLNLSARTGRIQDFLQLSKECKAWDPKECFIGNAQCVEYFDQNWLDELIEKFKQEELEEKRKKEKRRLIKLSNLEEKDRDYYSSILAKNDHENIMNKYHGITNRTNILETSTIRIAMPKGPTPGPEFDYSTEHGPILGKVGKRQSRQSHHSSNHSSHRRNRSHKSCKAKEKERARRKKREIEDYRKRREDRLNRKEHLGYSPSKTKTYEETRCSKRKTRMNDWERDWDMWKENDRNEKPIYEEMNEPKMDGLYHPPEISNTDKWNACSPHLHPPSFYPDTQNTPLMNPSNSGQLYATSANHDLWDELF